MNRRSAVGWILVVVGLLAGAAVYLFGRPRAVDSPVSSAPVVRSVDELQDGVFEVDPEHWHSFFNRGRPAETGWIALPARPEPVWSAKGSVADEGSHAAVVEAQVCGECHARVLEGFLQTAHHRTLRTAAPETVVGNFEPGGNRMPTNDPNLSFVMERNGNEYLQRVLLKRGEETYAHGARLDLVAGSGNHAQTYLYWQDDALYQLPISYLTESQAWVFSPSFYLNGTADFARPITSRCLECHATYFENVAGTTNRYVRDGASLGVSCVRCHGPGAEHVAYHREHPGEQAGQHIVHPGNLPRDRANEICAQCHAGIGQSLKPPFSYRPGEPLEESLKLEHRGEEIQGGVHTDDQLARLQMSRCFQASDSMTCATCHDPHRDEHGQRALFAERCRTCHQDEQCQVHAEVGAAIHDRCIDCHMPKRRDLELKFDTDAGIVDLLLLRDHFIQGWPVATEEVLKELRAVRADDGRRLEDGNR